MACSWTPSRSGSRWSARSWPGSAEPGGTRTRPSLSAAQLVKSVGYMLAMAALPAAPATVARWLVDGMVTRLTGRRPADAARRPRAARRGGLGRNPVRPGHVVRAANHGCGHSGRSGIAFGATVCAADVSAAKPDPEPYLLASKLLGADPRRCVVLEDSPNGVAAAEAAGCRGGRRAQRGADPGSGRAGWSRPRWTRSISPRCARPCPPGSRRLRACLRALARRRDGP